MHHIPLDLPHGTVHRLGSVPCVGALINKDLLQRSVRVLVSVSVFLACGHVRAKIARSTWPAAAIAAMSGRVPSRGLACEREGVFFLRFMGVSPLCAWSALCSTDGHAVLRVAKAARAVDAEDGVQISSQVGHSPIVAFGMRDETIGLRDGYRFGLVGRWIRLEDCSED